MTRKTISAKLIQLERNRQLERDVQRAIRAEQRERAAVQRLMRDPWAHNALTAAFRTPEWARRLVIGTDDEYELDERELWELVSN